MKTTGVAVLILLTSALLLSQNNPVPLINNPLMPTSVAPGGPLFTLTVNGSGFISGATVDWNGSPLATTFVSGSRLTATVPSANIATASTASVTVVNQGGRVSNVAYLGITSPINTVLLNEGEPLSTDSTALFTADFNRDGRLDLATVNNVVASVSVFLGNGDGTFQPAHSFSTGGYALSVTAADFNNDGLLDLAVSTQDPFTVSVLLGNGDGTFQPFKAFAMSSASTGTIATGDFNRDGNLDVLVPINGLSAVLLGNGDGTFQAPITSASIGYSVAVGDFNLDGRLDIATTGNNGNYVYVSIGNGDGSFQSPQQYSSGLGTPENLIAADLNGDGFLDVATANYDSNQGGYISVLLGNGDGTLKVAQNYKTQGVNAYSLVAGDFNADGMIDLAVETSEPNLLGLFATSLFFGIGDGTFQPHVDYPGWSNTVAIAEADLNNDGKLDYLTSQIAALIQDEGTVIVLSPNQLKFPTQMVGTVSQAQTIQVANSGTNTVTVSSIAATSNTSPSNTNNFEQLNLCPAQLQAGASCTVDVFFTPEQQGSLTGYLAVFDTGGGSPQTVALSGTGTVVQISPSSLSFGNQQVGISSLPKNIRVTNRGGKSITISSITITGANASDYAQVNACGSTLGPGASCSIAVVFTPTQTGTRTAMVSISDTGGGSPQKVKLTGTGT